jgi:hypothetical protein
MDAQELRNLQEAYMEVVSNNNELSEMSYKKLPVGKMMWKAVNRTEREANARADREREANEPNSTITYDRAREEHEKAEKNKERNYKMVRVADTHSKKEAKAKSKLKNEEVDLYDIILSHLLDEGYAETQEQAEVIMVNMSEEWREGIVEGNENNEMTRIDKKDLRNKKFIKNSPYGEFNPRTTDKRRVDAHDDRRGVKLKKN